MRFEISDDEVAPLCARLGLPNGVTKPQVEDALIAFFNGEFQPRARARMALRPEELRNDPTCEQAISAAIADEKITHARADHYRHRWGRDPAGTAQLLAPLTPVAGLNVPVAAAPPGPAEPAYPRAWLQAVPDPAPAPPPRRGRVTFGGD